jgi:hypothetical protein
MPLLLGTTDHHQRFTEIGLRVPGRMRQRYEHLLVAQTCLAHVILYHRVAAAEAVLRIQPLPDPLGGENLLQAQGAGTVLLAGHKPHRPKPDGEGLPRLLEHGASRHRRLTVASRTLEQGGTHPPRRRLLRVPLSLAVAGRKSPRVNRPFGDHTTGSGSLSQMHT